MQCTIDRHKLAACQGQVVTLDTERTHVKKAAQIKKWKSNKISKQAMPFRHHASFHVLLSFTDGVTVFFSSTPICLPSSQPLYFSSFSIAIISTYPHARTHLALGKCCLALLSLSTVPLSQSHFPTRRSHPSHPVNSSLLSLSWQNTQTHYTSHTHGHAHCRFSFS